MENNSGEFLLIARHANTLKSYLWAFMTEYVWKCNTICLQREVRNAQRELRDADGIPAASGVAQNAHTLLVPLCCTDRNR